MSLAATIKNISQLHGTFVLRSGKTSTTYFDKYRFESDPRVLAQIARELSALVPADTQVLCGLEMGGIPIVSSLSFACSDCRISHHGAPPACRCNSHGYILFASGV